MRNNILFGKEGINPYYIMAPSYLETSAGIKVLHLLCHHLNLKGYPSFIATFGENYYQTKPGLITPILDEKVIDFHRKNKMQPVVIYPDVVLGNPLNAGCVVRYLLNYKGLLGGEDKFSEHDLIFAYGKKISENAGINEDRILFIPISNTSIFYPPENDLKREGSCFYASKYQSYHKGELSDITKNSTEITRDLPNSQTTEEVGDLLRKSEVFYTYENTSLITEAILCGCPAVMIKNQFFDGDPLARHELGNEGVASENTPESIALAKKTIPLAQKNFFNAVDNFWTQLDNFIKITQEFSSKTKASDFRIIPSKKKRIPIGRLIKQQLIELIKK